MKKQLTCDKFYVFWAGTKKHKFTVRYVVFDPKKAISSDEAKKLANKSMHITKREMSEKYDVMYAKSSKLKRKLIFTFCVKPEADTIFIIPKKYRKEARKVITTYFS